MAAGGLPAVRRRQSADASVSPRLSVRPADWRPGPIGSRMVAMTLSTAFTEMFGIRHPIALAPMGGSAGGALAAAVSNGGGLGLLGSGNGDRAWLARELPLLVEGTSQPWGVGFQSWAIDPSVVEYALGFEPRAVMLSFGDPRPFAGIVRQSGATLDHPGHRSGGGPAGGGRGRRRDRRAGHRGRRARRPARVVDAGVRAGRGGPGRPVPVLAAGGSRTGGGWPPRSRSARPGR